MSSSSSLTNFCLLLLLTALASNEADFTGSRNELRPFSGNINHPPHTIGEPDDFILFDDDLVVDAGEAVGEVVTARTPSTISALGNNNFSVMTASTPSQMMPSSGDEMPTPAVVTIVTNGVNIAAPPDWGNIDHLQYRPTEYHLLRNLLRHYDRRVRPVPKNSILVNVTFGIALAQIIDVDEKNQLITTNCWLNSAWVDFQLSWDPLLWNGVEILRIPYNHIWLPDVLLYNNADVMTHFSSLSSNVIVHHSGNVTWLTMSIFKSTCSIDVKYFPFDVQNCSLNFASWTYDGFQMDIQGSTGGEGDVSNYIENTEWQLLNFSRTQDIRFFSCCPNEPYPFVTYYLVIRRRPLYYVYNLLMPCIMITLTALLGFYVPSDSGEKVTMGITTLLSMTVFLMVVAESMPPTKSHVPLLGLYYGFTIIVVSCTTALTVLTLNLHHRGKRGIRMPRFLQFFVFKILAKLVFYTVHLPNSYEIKEEDKRLLRTSKTLSPPYGSSKCMFKKETLSATNDTSDGSGDDFCISDLNTTCLSNSEDTINCLKTCALDECSNAKVTALFIHVNNLERYLRKLLIVSEKQRNNQRIKEAIEAEWEQTAAIIDRLLLFIFLTTTILITLSITSYAPSGTFQIDN